MDAETKALVERLREPKPEHDHHCPAKWDVDEKAACVCGADERIQAWHDARHEAATALERALAAAQPDTVCVPRGDLEFLLGKTEPLGDWADQAVHHYVKAMLAAAGKDR